MPSSSSSGHCIGLMSGTSLDGVDGVLADFSSATPRVLASHFVPMPAALRAELLALNTPGDNELHRAHIAAQQLVDLYADTVQALLHRSGLPASAIAAIGAHGQTVRHQPPPTAHPYTLQLNQPALLAERTGIAVVADFRSRDVAAGGQGAPLVPAFHQHIFGQAHQALAVVNIGGIANATALPGDGRVLGLDTGPGNVLLDLWCARHTGQPYDAHGAWAAQGSSNTALLQHLLADPYFQRSGIKSTGRDLFHADWLAQQLQDFAHVPAVDVQATLVQLTARSIAQGLHALPWAVERVQTVWICGGGAYNATLMAALQQQLPHAQVRPTSEAGWPVSWVEAAAFAWLARQTLLGLPGNEPQVTGARGLRVLGAIYPA